MNHKFKGSSNIDEISFDKEAKEVTVKFHSGASHTYADVPEEHFHKMQQSESAGKYFHAHIRDKFKSKRLES